LWIGGNSGELRLLSLSRLFEFHFGSQAQGLEK